MTVRRATRPGSRIALALVPALAAAVVLAAGTVSAAVPSTLAVQGRLTTQGGAPVVDGTYGLTFALYDAETAKQSLWSELVLVVVEHGGFDVELGKSKALGAGVVDAGKARWLGIAVGKDPELARQRLHAVPYARRAATAAKLSCSGCIGSEHLGLGALAGKALAKGAVTADKVSFAWAKADQAGGVAIAAKTADKAKMADKASDLQCTGCVSSKEMLFDGDLELGGNAIKAKLGVFTGGVAAAKVTANVFVGDGSQLTGLKLPKGKCKAGQVVAGIAQDGSLQCVVAAAGLPPDGLAAVSNGLLSNVFAASHAAAKGAPIPDNDPIGVSLKVVVPDLGVVKALTVSVAIQSSDISGLKVVLYDPANQSHVLHSNSGSGKALDTVYPTLTKPVSGDLGAWLGKSAKGTWQLKVVDLKKGPGGDDGAVTGFSVDIKWLSKQKVAAHGIFEATQGLVIQEAGKAPAPCTAAATGRVWFDKTSPAFHICDGADWQTFKPVSLCGNGALNGGEQCDDGNTEGGDGCTPACKKNVCGDGIVHVGVEQCDDGNTKSGDQCSSTCKLEVYKSCKHARDAAKATKTGVYSVDPDGPGGIPTFKVFCDMETDGGGWTLVARGKGGSTGGWGTTGDLNIAAATGLGATFKWSDAKINALVTERYRWTYDGAKLGAGAKGQGAWWYFNAQGCVYAHNSKATGNCDRAWGDVKLTAGPIPGTNTTTSYMGLDGGGPNYVHTHHSGPTWYIRDHHTYAKGSGSTWCNGGHVGCDVALWVR